MTIDIQLRLGDGTLKLSRIFVVRIAAAKWEEFLIRDRTLRAHAISPKIAVASEIKEKAKSSHGVKGGANGQK